MSRDQEVASVRIPGKLCAMCAAMQCHPRIGVVTVIECRRTETVAQDIQARENYLRAISWCCRLSCRQHFIYLSCALHFGRRLTSSFDSWPHLPLPSRHGIPCL